MIPDSSKLNNRPEIQKPKGKNPNKYTQKKEENSQDEKLDKDSRKENLKDLNSNLNILEFKTEKKSKDKSIAFKTNELLKLQQELDNDLKRYKEEITSSKKNSKRATSNNILKIKADSNVKNQKSIQQFIKNSSIPKYAIRQNS